MLPFKTSPSIISFSFDDVPKAALDTGGRILAMHGIKATYYVSLGLLGSETEVGAIASLDDLLHALSEGHELGCHTFDYLDSWETTTEKSLESVAKNQQALRKITWGDVQNFWVSKEWGQARHQTTPSKVLYVLPRRWAGSYNGSKFAKSLLP